MKIIITAMSFTSEVLSVHYRWTGSTSDAVTMDGLTIEGSLLHSAVKLLGGDFVNFVSRHIVNLVHLRSNCLACLTFPIHTPPGIVP